MAATSGDAAAACPAYPWPSDGAQRGRKAFMQSDCAACHSMLPYAGLSDEAAARAEAVQPAAAEIVVVEEAQPAAAVNGGARLPDLSQRGYQATSTPARAPPPPPCARS